MIQNFLLHTDNSAQILYLATAEVDVPMGFDKTASREFFVTKLHDLNDIPGTLQQAEGQAHKKFGGFLCCGGKEAEVKVCMVSSKLWIGW